MSGESLTALQSLETDRDKANLITYKFEEWDSYREHAKARWKEIEAYRYSTDTHSLPNAKSAFTHSTHTPILASIAQDLEAILLQVVMPHEDWFSFQPMDSQEARKAQRKAITSYLKNRHALNGLENEVAKLRSDLVTYGNCFAMTFHVNESVGDKEGYVGPKTKRISPYDIVFDPTATDFKRTPKIIREIVSLGELKKRAMSGKFREEAVNEILNNRTSYSNTDSTDEKDQQYTPLGFGTYQQYMTSGFVELLWFYGDIYDSHSQELLEGKVMVVADSDQLLMEDDINTTSGIPHIEHAVWQKLPDNLWGMGPLDNIVGLNFQINHRENAKSEALDRLIYPDKVYMGDVEEMYDEETGQVTYLAPEGGNVAELAVNTQFFSFDLHIDRLQFSSRAAARLPSDLTGFRSQGEKTLGEVTALTEGGMRGFIDKAGDFEKNMLEPILKAEIELAHQNFGSAISVPSKNEEGFLSMLSITKEDLNVKGILIPKGARRFARKNQILGSLTQISATPLAQLAIQHISGKQAAELMSELLEVQDTGLFGPFAQIIEQGEAQQMANIVEQQAVLASSQPSVEEEMLDQAVVDEELGEEL
jgi:hypothetical protein